MAESNRAAVILRYGETFSLATYGFSVDDVDMTLLVGLQNHEASSKCDAYHRVNYYLGSF